MSDPMTVAIEDIAEKLALERQERERREVQLADALGAKRPHPWPELLKMVRALTGR